MNTRATEKVAFVGLGVMGYPMAGHLARKGHDVTVYNRTAAKAAAWVKQYGGRRAATPADAAKDARFVMACVGNDDDLRSVVLGPNGILAGMDKGAIFIDHTTASAGIAEEIAAIATESGFGFLDGPVSGGQSGAENGQLTVMMGGKPADFRKAEPVIAAYAKKISLIGPVGAGQLTKMVNQICIAGTVQGLAEGLLLAAAAGLDGTKVIEAISKGAAQSWQMDNRAATMLGGKFDYGFAVDWMRKDLGICLASARGLGASLPLTALVDQFYADVQNLGGGRFDTSSLLLRLQALSGKKTKAAAKNKTKAKVKARARK